MPQAQPELKKVCRPAFRFLRALMGSKAAKASFPHIMFEQQLTVWQYLDKRIEVQLNGSRKVMGTLRGYDVRSRDMMCATRTSGNLNTKR